MIKRKNGTMFKTREILCRSLVDDGEWEFDWTDEEHEEEELAWRLEEYLIENPMPFEEFMRLLETSYCFPPVESHYVISRLKWGNEKITLNSGRVTTIRDQLHDWEKFRGGPGRFLRDPQW